MVSPTASLPSRGRGRGGRAAQASRSSSRTIRRDPASRSRSTRSSASRVLEPLVAGVKAEAPPTSGAIEALRRRCPELGAVGGLGGMFLVDELRAGATGTMTGLAVPEHLVSIVRSFANDPDGRRARVDRAPAADPPRGVPAAQPRGSQGGLAVPRRHRVRALPARRGPPRRARARGRPPGVRPGDGGRSRPGGGDTEPLTRGSRDAGCCAAACRRPHRCCSGPAAAAPRRRRRPRAPRTVPASAAPTVAPDLAGGPSSSPRRRSRRGSPGCWSSVSAG